MTRRPAQLFIAGEDRGHREVCTTLVDTVLRASVDWLVDIDDLDHVRMWRGRAPEDAIYLHKYARDDARALGFRAHGFIDGRPAGEEAHFLRCVFFIAEESIPSVAVIARDADGEPARRASFDVVLARFPPPFPVVYAAPQPEIEAWLVAGFEPAGDAECSLVEELRKRLGFHAHEHPHRLTSKNEHDLKDAKRVARHLGCQDGERRDACLGDHVRLRMRGGGCGLVDFLDQVVEKLVPVVR
jgi:hypothetical protein